MKSSKFIFIAISFCLLFFASNFAMAQTKVTFNVNLKKQMKDSTFVPGLGDVAEVTGDLYPLGRRNITMSDTDADSIYTAEVRFSGAANNKNLTFNYVLNTREKVMKEQSPRKLRLSGKEIKLDALYFGAFAW